MNRYLVGQNSSGKTSLLQALTLALVEESYSGESNEKYPHYISKSQEKAKIILSIDKYEKEVQVLATKREIKNNILSPFVLSYGSNIFTKYEITVDSLVERMLDEKINKDFVSSIFKDYTDKFHNPKSIINKLSSIDTDKSRELRDVFVNIINDFLEDLDLSLEKEDSVYIFKDVNKTRLKLENLSEGYRNNILLISDILIRILGVGERPKTIEGIILIDEFDRHLHPKWQSNVVSKLSDTFPHIQFILTTHNPMSTLDRDDDEITVLKEIDGELKATRGKGTKNIDVGMVLLDYFGVDSLVGKTMQENIKRVTILKLQDSLDDEEKEELANLKIFFENSVDASFIYNKSYFNFLKFLKQNEDIEFSEYGNMSDEKMEELMEKYKDIL